MLVNNAGIVKDSLFASMSFDDFSRGRHQPVQHFPSDERSLNAAALRRKPGHHQCGLHCGHYPKRRAGELQRVEGRNPGFTRTLAAELAPYGVRVNAIAPGMIESKMVKKVSRTVVRGVTASIPLRRLGKCDEVANTVVYLGSTASSYIVGQTIVIDGGR